MSQEAVCFLYLRCPGYCREFKQTVRGFGETTAVLKRVNVLRAAPGTLAACRGGEETCGPQIFLRTPINPTT